MIKRIEWLKTDERDFEKNFLTSFSFHNIFRKSIHNKKVRFLISKKLISFQYFIKFYIKYTFHLKLNLVLL